MSRRSHRILGTADDRPRLKRPSIAQVRQLARLEGCRCHPDVALGRAAADVFYAGIFHDAGCPLYTDDPRGGPLRMGLFRSEPVT